MSSGSFLLSVELFAIAAVRPRPRDAPRPAIRPGPRDEARPALGGPLELEVEVAAGLCCGAG